jgi:hypothetical protein
MHGLPNMADEPAWYAKYHPDLPVGSVIPVICLDCGYDYAVGHSIVARDPDDSMIYSVSSLMRRESQPPLIMAVAPDGTTRYFAVTQVRPHRIRERVLHDPLRPDVPRHFFD